MYTAWSVEFYSTGTWTIFKADRREIKDFQNVWCWKRTLEIFWADKIRNDVIETNEVKPPWKTVKEKQ